MPSITQSAAPCHIPADAAEEVLLRVDTHKDVHAAAVTTVLGAALDGRSFWRPRRDAANSSPVPARSE
ncbi:hypothetical protein GCM10018966_000150 [Streptomyces yanii]